MLKHNYHTHTDYCGHSSLKAEEQIKLAIENKLMTIGFSEHIDLPSTEGSLRITNGDSFSEFVEEVLILKEKYKDKIDVLIGLESEAVDHLDNGKSLSEHLAKRMHAPGVEYFIAGLHFYSNGDLAKMYRGNMENSIKYVDSFRELIKKMRPLYLAHPDVFLLTKGDDKWTDEEEFVAKNIIEICSIENIVMGINVSGLRHNENYPNLKFFKKAKRAGCRAIIELDSHSINDWSEEWYLKALKFAEDLGIELVEKLEI